MTLKVYGRNSSSACKLVQKRINDIENILSVTKSESDLYKINNSGKQELTVRDETLFLSEYTQKIYNLSGGILNPALYPVIYEWGFTSGEYKIPSEDKIAFLLQNTDFSRIKTDSEKKLIFIPDGMKLDFGAVGKGFAGDEAIAVLKANGIKSALLDLGGNIQALGTKPDGSKWNIGIKNPFDKNIAAGIKIEDECVITSGGYERYFIGEDGKKYIHIFDAKKGRPVENEIESVSIIAKSGLYADSLSTTLFAMGLEEACNFWKKYQDFECIIITNEKKLYFTKNLKEKLDLKSDFEVIELD